MGSDSIAHESKSRVFFPPYSSCPFCTFSIFFSFFFFFFCRFFYFLYSFTKMKACTVCANAQASVLRSSGHSVTEIAKLLNKSERYKWTGVQKKIAVFFWFKCVRNVIEKAVSICVIILQERKVKKIQLHSFKVSSTTVWRYMTNKGWKAVNRKRRRTCRHGAEGFGKFIAKDDLQTRLSTSYILYLTTYKMSDNIKEDILVTYNSVIQC